MAITLSTEIASITKEERTCRIVIETPKGGEPVLHIEREQASFLGDGTVLGTSPIGTVTKTLSQVANTSFNVGNITLTGTITGAQMAVALAEIADQIRQEDMPPA